MRPVLGILIIKRFRSIPAARIVFANPTFLVGRNGAGKSNIRDAIDFLAEVMSSPLQAVLDRRGGISAVRNRTPGPGYPPNFGLGVIMTGIGGSIGTAHYAFEVKATKNYGFKVIREECIVISVNQKEGEETPMFNRRGGDFQTNVAGLKPSLEGSALALPLVGGDVHFAPVVRALAGMRSYGIEPARLREMQDPDSGLVLKPDGSNAASVLQEIQRQDPEDARRIDEILATIVPNTTQVRPIRHGNKVALEFTQEWASKQSLRFESFSMSDGTLRALGMLTAVYQKPRPSLIVVEEPEATIHPGALGSVLDLLRHASRQMQVIVTTHSPDLLDAEWLEDHHLRLVSWYDGATHVTRLSEGSREALDNHLMSAGDLLRSNALRGESISPISHQQDDLFLDHLA